MGCNTSQEQNTSPDNINENGDVKNENDDGLAEEVKGTAEDVKTDTKANVVNGNDNKTVNVTTPKENGKLSRNNSNNEELVSKELTTKANEAVNGEDGGGGGDIKKNENSTTENTINHQLNGEVDMNGFDFDGSPEEGES